MPNVEMYMPDFYAMQMVPRIVIPFSKMYCPIFIVIKQGDEITVTIEGDLP